MKKKNFAPILLLVVIYLAFIALGLPDAILGSAWNLVRMDLQVSLGTLGIMTVMVYIFSVLSTFNAPRILRLLETKKVVFISILFTGVALLLISRVSAFYQMLFFAIPLGIGAGAIDVSLNHYLASNYKATHMNYLHTFYGIGVTLGPSVMAFTLKNNSWRIGYVVVGSILLIIALIVFVSFKLWKEQSEEERSELHTPISTKEIVKTKGVIASILIFLFYVHIESLGGVWISSYYFETKSITYSDAALFTMTFYLALTIGRFLSALLSHVVKPNTLILLGESLIVLSGALMFIKVNQIEVYYAVVFLFGLGCAPVFPNMMYMNSQNFDKSKMSKVISLQMAFGYIGFGLLTPLAGLLFEKINISIYPIFILLVSSLILGMTIRFIYTIKKGEKTHEVFEG
ncbi:MAG: sugar MFS transporter [Candidatus Izemoplasmatales bacterium]